MSDAAGARARYTRWLRRPWRLAFVAYALAMTTGTHWPRLQLDATGIPASDKVIHSIAFGAGAFLLWRTGWIARLGALFVVAIAWAVADEFSQAIPGLGRSASREDLIADCLGVVLAGTWIGAFSPRGPELARTFQAHDRRVLERVYARWGTWFLMGGICAVCGAPLALAWSRLSPDRTGLPTLLTLVAIAITCGLATHVLFRRERAQVERRRLCTGCGSDVAPDVAETPGTCPVCASALPPPGGPSATPTILATAVTMPAVIVLVAGGIIAMSIMLEMPRPPFPETLRTVAALTVGGVLLALAVRLLRARWWRRRVEREPAPAEREPDSRSSA